MKYKILVIDDEESVAYSVKRILEQDNDSEIDIVYNGTDGINLYKKNRYDIVITDLIMGEVNGIEVVEEIKSIDEEALIIMITGKGSENIAAQAIKKGAYDYFSKPFNYIDFFKTIRNAKEKIKLKNEKKELENVLDNSNNFYGIYYVSDEIKKIVSVIKKIAKINSTVLITGESGVGKERIAESLHLCSNRADGPLIKINCGAIPANLMESELFGHEKGAFTGASMMRKGKLELADGGSIFLDEIGEMDLLLQVKLLRILEDGILERVGGTSSKKIDVRVIAATNVDLEKAIEEKKFRLDLYYRLNVFKIEIPSLSKRKDDIIFLANKYIEEYAKSFDLEMKDINEKVKRAFLKYSWPGNVRELKNVIQKLMIFSKEDFLDFNELPDNMKNNEENFLLEDNCFEEKGLKDYMKEKEKIYLKYMLEKYGQNKTELAEKLEISRKSMYEKIKEYGL